MVTTYVCLCGRVHDQGVIVEKVNGAPVGVGGGEASAEHAESQHHAGAESGDGKDAE